MAVAQIRGPCIAERMADSGGPTLAVAAAVARFGSTRTELRPGMKAGW
jgi:hypothetical protein